MQERFIEANSCQWQQKIVTEKLELAIPTRTVHTKSDSLAISLTWLPVKTPRLCFRLKSSTVFIPRMGIRITWYILRDVSNMSKLLLTIIDVVSERYLDVWSVPWNSTYTGPYKKVLNNRWSLCTIFKFIKTCSLSGGDTWNRLTRYTMYQG